MNGLTISLPPELVAEIVERVKAEVLRELQRQPAGSLWLFGAQAAADYLGCSRQRIYKQLHAMPYRKDGSRLIFRKDELDSYMEKERM